MRFEGGLNMVKSALVLEVESSWRRSPSYVEIPKESLYSRKWPFSSDLSLESLASILENILSTVSEV